MKQKNQMLEMQASQYVTFSPICYPDQPSASRLPSHGRTITALAEQKEYERLPPISGRLQSADERLGSRPLLLLFSPLANAVLAYYGDIAARQQIPFHCEADLPASLTVSDVDLCVILGNLMENAIQGSLTIPAAERYIHLSMDTEDPGEFLHSSHKPVRRLHPGAGRPDSLFLKRVTASAFLNPGYRRKYHGLARFEYHEQEFSASIMLKLAPPAADPAKL